MQIIKLWSGRYYD